MLVLYTVSQHRRPRIGRLSVITSRHQKYLSFLCYCSVKLLEGISQIRTRCLWKCRDKLHPNKNYSATREIFCFTRIDFALSFQ